MLLIIFQFIW